MSTYTPADLPSSDLQRHLTAFAKVIAEDRVQGATTLARRAVTLLCDAARLDPEQFDVDVGTLADALLALAETMGAARPNMTPIRVLTDAWRAAVAAELQAATDFPGLIRATSSAADVVLQSAEQATAETVRQLAASLAGVRVVFTHSASSTVARALIAAKQARGAAPLELIATESRPGREGAPQARYLAGQGIPATIITDAAAAQFLPQADALVLGADCVFADGAVANKMGSRMMAMVAGASDVPVLVGAERFKYVEADATHFVSEEQDPDEVQPRADGVVVRNPTFEVVPRELIAAIYSNP